VKSCEIHSKKRHELDGSTITDHLRKGEETLLCEEGASVAIRENHSMNKGRPERRKSEGRRGCRSIKGI